MKCVHVAAIFWRVSVWENMRLVDGKPVKPNLKYIINSEATINADHFPNSKKGLDPRKIYLGNVKYLHGLTCPQQIIMYSTTPSL